MPPDPLYLVLLGGPGAGKGTQAERLSRTLGIPQVSTGELFRENLKNQTQLGLLAKGYMDRGELVPDEVTVGMVRERLTKPDAVCGQSWMVFSNRGAGRGVGETLADRCWSWRRPYIEVPEDVLLARLAGRWTCRACGAMYHQVGHKQTGVWTGCMVNCTTPDDTPETQERRIMVYWSRRRR
jgi:adenylate kinase